MQRLHHPMHLKRIDLRQREYVFLVSIEHVSRLVRRQRRTPLTPEAIALQYHLCPRISNHHPHILRPPLLPFRIRPTKGCPSIIGESTSKGIVHRISWRSEVGTIARWRGIGSIFHLNSGLGDASVLHGRNLFLVLRCSLFSLFLLST